MKEIQVEEIAEKPLQNTEKGLIVAGVPERNLLVGETMELYAYTEGDPFCSYSVSWEYDKNVFNMVTQYRFPQTYICLTAKKPTKATQIKAELLPYTSSFAIGIDSMQIYLSPANHDKEYATTVSGNTTEKANMEAVAAYLKEFLNNYCVDVKVPDVHDPLDIYDERLQDAKKWFRDKDKALYLALRGNTRPKGISVELYGSTGYYNRLRNMDALVAELVKTVDAVLPKGSNQSVHTILADYIEGDPEYINPNLSFKPSENAVFSRRFACFVFQPYVFSLVFALTSRNKGKCLSKCQTSFSAGNKPSALESEIHPSHKLMVCTRDISR